MRFFLIGYRAVGKTTIGKLLAKKLKLNFADSDELIVKYAKQDIKKIVEEHGWKFFREKEKEIINKLCQKENIVVATGGGAILLAENIETMRQSGTIILLDASISEITKRFCKDNKSKTNRPPLHNKSENNQIYDLKTEIKENYMTRYPIYQDAANIIINTDNKDTEKIISEIIIKIGK